MTEIRHLLVANRGEIARRVFRTARSLGISTVAVYSDADAAMPYVREADVAVRLPGNSPADTYLNSDAILAAAARAGADALHPGYGFLSENAAFARACGAAGLTFVGPTPATIEAMSSKLAAKELMASHGVPVLEGRAVASTEDVLAVAAEAGWPLLLKAAFGGGGRGMRILEGPDDVAAALESTRREALNAFGDPTVFAERLVEAPRHIEVQIIGDMNGTVVHLFERECSIQRRFQKVIEECPSPLVDTEMRARLGAAAVAAAQAIVYHGAGTVEFVADNAGDFYFLEINTRLQVEHPVTEAVTGLDLVALQLGVAEGKPLPSEVLNAKITGHAIEARLYAEDVSAGFLPVAGRLHRFEIEAGEGVRVDTGVESGSVVSPYYDAMIAKVIASGRTRDEAARRLRKALRTARLHGLVTNRDLLLGVLDNADFLAGMTDTGFLVRHDPAALAAAGAGTSQSERLPVHAVAAALALQAANRAGATVQSGIPSGWRNVRDLPQRQGFSEGDVDVEVAYSVAPDGTVESWVDGEPWRVLHASPSEVVVQVQDLGIHVAVDRDGDVSYTDSVLGHSALRSKPRFPPPKGLLAAGSLLSPMPGAVTRVLAAEGDQVAKGTVLLYLEAMKMEHPVRSPGPGVVRDINVAAGDQVEAGAVLVVIDPTGAT